MRSAVSRSYCYPFNCLCMCCVCGGCNLPCCGGRRSKHFCPPLFRSLRGADRVFWYPSRLLVALPMFGLSERRTLRFVSFGFVSEQYPCTILTKGTYRYVMFRFNSDYGAFHTPGDWIFHCQIFNYFPITGNPLISRTTLLRSLLSTQTGSSFFYPLPMELSSMRLRSLLMYLRVA
jgi:hypothetical protein